MSDSDSAASIVACMQRKSRSSVGPPWLRDNLGPTPHTHTKMALRSIGSSMATAIASRRGVSAALGCGPSDGIAGHLNSATPTQRRRDMTILSKESAAEFRKENYNARMAATGRPVSPHVTIYSFPVGALSSITNRVTGVMLSFGAAGLGAVELVGGSGAGVDLMSAIGGSGGVVEAGAKFAVAFPFIYHYMGGARHLMWDNKPEMLTNVDVEKATYALVGGSLLLSTAAVFI